jgi:oligopeptidase A
MDFSWIQWTPAQIAAITDEALAYQRQGLANMKAIPAAERTFENTLASPERAGDRLADVQQALEFLVNVHPDPAIRQAARTAVERIEKEHIAMFYDRELWRGIKEWQALNERLDPANRKLADDAIRDMRRMGFDLLDEQFERLKKVSEDLKRLESEFEQTIN